VTTECDRNGGAEENKTAAEREDGGRSVSNMHLYSMHGYTHEIPVGPPSRTMVIRGGGGEVESGEEWGKRRRANVQVSASGGVALCLRTE
jgi:hypothetical protein